ncbi:lysophospholipase [Microbulbifer sp. TYP-18]|uniref:lysophospholipase n=1 Tax=Microbulbifer sp. TYP-18 TaxID=3230024 RepID=UPI0034C6A92C
MLFMCGDERLHYRRWWVEGAHGVVVIAHGLGEHSGRYRRLALDLNRAGYSVYALDHYGHGQSSGKRGHVDEFAHYGDQLQEFVLLARRDNPAAQIHLLGHSMGGVIACDCVQRFNSVDSLILSAPAFRGLQEPGNLVRALISVLARPLPRLTLPNRVDPRWLSRDEAVAEAYRKDELVHNRVSLRWFTDFLRQRDLVIARLGQIRVPCLLLLPMSDRLVDSPFTQGLFERIGSAQKWCHVFPGAYHELFNEACGEPDAVELLRQHLAALQPQTEALASV